MIKLVKSSFYHEAETKKALAEFILGSEVLSMNSECERFERAFSERQERRYSVFVGSGSGANLLLIQSMLNLGRLTPGAKIGFSALTWPTNVMPIMQLGLEPVAIDCTLETLNVSPDELERYIPQLDGLFLTNVLGFCDDLPRIAQLCEQYGVLLLEDNCESLGSKVDQTLLGNFGLASTFSFFVGHHLSTIEGGMVCTDDEELYKQLTMGRAHGWDRNLELGAQQALRASTGANAFYAKYTFHDLAFNLRPTEINGFIGNAQIIYWHEIVGRRVRNFHRFRTAMSEVEDFYQYDLSHMEIASNFAMPIVCKSPQLAERYRARFEEGDVEIRPIIGGNMTRQPFYRKYILDGLPMPNSDLVHMNGFYFGNNPEMTEEEVVKLCRLLSEG